jgi:ribonuclease-3
MKPISERKFKNEKLRTEALTHKSYVYENPMSGHHNERLEFLGDAVISCVVVDYLHDRFKEYNEGQLTILKAKLVCRQALSSFALQLGLNEHLKLGTGAIKTNARNSEKVLEDTFEAYMGAVFLDTGKNYDEVMKFMEPFLISKVDQFTKDNLVTNPSSDPNRPTYGPIDTSLLDLPPESDPISRLQTWSLRRSYGTPRYDEVETGPVHNCKFTFEVVINGKIYGTGSARSKKEAKKLAAINSLKEIFPPNIH